MPPVISTQHLINLFGVDGKTASTMARRKANDPGFWDAYYEIYIQVNDEYRIADDGKLHPLTRLKIKRD